VRKRPKNAAVGHPLRLDDVRCGHRRRPDRANLAAADQISQCGQRFLDVSVGIGAVDLVEVDVIGAQSTQGAFDGGDDPAPRLLREARTRVPPEANAARAEIGLVLVALVAAAWLRRDRRSLPSAS